MTAVGLGGFDLWGKRNGIATSSMFLSLVLANLACYRCSECVADALDGNAVKDLLEKSGDDHSNRFGPRETSRLCVENQFFVDSPTGATVSASHVVGIDLQTRNRVGSSCIA